MQKPKNPPESLSGGFLLDHGLESLTAGRTVLTFQPLELFCQAFSTSVKILSPGMPRSMVIRARRPDL